MSDGVNECDKKRMTASWDLNHMENECRGDGKDWKGRNEADPWGNLKERLQSRSKVSVDTEEFGVKTSMWQKLLSLGPLGQRVNV